MSRYFHCMDFESTKSKAAREKSTGLVALLENGGSEASALDSFRWSRGLLQETYSSHALGSAYCTLQGHDVMYLDRVFEPRSTAALENDFLK